MGLTDKFKQINKLLQIIDKDRTIPSSFYEGRINHIPNPDKPITNKKNNRPRTLINIRHKKIYKSSKLNLALYKKNNT